MAAQIDRLSVDLEIVTPLFLGGANPQGPPELRPPSVRGALRFWWRAWHQACAPSTTAEELYRAESQVFGNTGAASPLVVRTAGHPQRIDMARPEQPAGLNYLLYGLHTRSSEGPVRLRYRPAFNPGQHLSIALSGRLAPGGARLNPEALAALWLLCNLGGLGARTRRGAGAVRVLNVQGTWPDALPPLQLDARSPAELCSRLGSALRQLLDTAPRAAPVQLGIPSLHPALTWLGVFPKEWPNWEEALEEVGEAFRAFRNRHGPDYQGVKTFIQTGQPPATVERAAFGLPLQFFYRSLPANAPAGNKATVAGRRARARKIDRSASPLHFRVVPLTSGGCAVVALAFVLPLLPPRSTLSIQSALHSGSPQPPGQAILAKYMEAVSKQLGPWLEVDYA